MIEFFNTVFKYKGLLYYRTLASLRADARGLYLGYVWWFLEPVMNTALYYLIFGMILGNKTPNFIAYILIGTVIYQWFQASVMGTIGTVPARAHLYRQIPLPKYLFALIGVFCSTWKFFCVFIVLLFFVGKTVEVELRMNLFWLVPIGMIQLLVICGFALNFAIASAYFKDLQTFMSVFFRALMFLSGIFWDVQKVPEHLETLFYANPIASLIALFRSVLIDAQKPDYSLMLYLLLLSTVMINIGVAWHRRVDGHILKQIQT